MKKLTAGIFTALLGLVTVNAANAAIPSTNYVNEHIDAVRSGYESADTALRTRINGVESAYQAADSALDGRVTGLETTVGEGTMSVNGNTQNDVIAAINALDAKTNGIATNENLDKLQQTVTTHTNSLNVLNGTGEGSVAKAETDAVATANAYTDQLANGQVKTNKDAIAANAAAIEINTNAIAGKAAQSDLTALTTRVTTAEGDIDDLEALVGTTSVATQIENANNTQTASLQQYADQAETDAIASAKAYADGLASNYDAAGAAATAEANAATYTDGKIDDLAAIYETKTNVSNAVEELKDYADNAATQAETSANSYADGKLALKVDKAQGEGAANQVLITDASGNVTTSATIEQTQVNGLSDALAAKLPVTAANNADGKYVLTATALNGTITYAWEDISREVPVEN
ncbi:MAG: hypothetical protein IKA73_03955 [Alphaproteobacteria bacterium]|nr:hypothetical protein [Alphaproteobacteria bacterium]